LKKEIVCINSYCDKYQDSTDRRWIAQHGFYRRRCDSKLIQRFRCTSCGKTFSNQTFNLTFRQHKPRVNQMVRKVLCSKMSFRRAAKVLQLNRKTVVRKFKYLAEVARLNQKRRLAKLDGVDLIQLDEMETFEHSKCKPLSVALAVVPGTRIILGARASEMPAKGPLAEFSRKKYGRRRDDRQREFQNVLRTLLPTTTADVWLVSDKKSVYPNWIRAVLPGSTHFKVKGRRRCIAGYGEMKKIGFDPLFYLNQTAATIRDNLARMLRRTWCGTKKLAYLQDALDFHTDFHNEMMERDETLPIDRNEYLAKCRFYGAFVC
jgi:transposase-like protein